jgi:hypothetical protein
MAFIYLLSPVLDVDAFWQIRLGQLMQERRALITEDPFTYTHAGQSVPTIGWLAQLLLAGAYGAGKWPLVHFLNALLLAAAFAIAGWSAVRGAGGAPAAPVAAAGAVTLGFLVSLSNCDVRPQTIGLVCFALFLRVCGASLPWPGRMALLALILAIWQNSHPSVSMAIVASAALAAGAAIERRRGRPARAPGPYVVGLLLAIASQLATPMGPAIFAVSARNVEVSRSWLRVSEWLPPWSEQVRAPMQMFWVALALSLGLMVRLAARRRLKLEHAVLFVAMTAMALVAARFALFWGLAMVSVWACWLEEVTSHRLLRWRGDASLATRAWAPAGALSLAMVLVLPPLLRGPVLHAELPVAGVAALKRALPTGRIYNVREWSGPLILAGSPPWQLAIDGRLYIFERSEWLEYESVVRGEIPLQLLLARHAPDAFFLSPQYQPELVRQLKAAPAWREVYADTSCIAFVGTPEP